MTTALGLLGLLVFMVSVMTLAAAITWAVVKVTPSGDKKRKADVPAA